MYGFYGLKHHKMEEWRCRQFGPDKQQQWKIELLTELICLPNNFIFDLIIHPQHCNDRARCRVWPAGDSHICKVSLDDDSSLMRIIFEEFLGPKMCFFLLQAWWRWLDHQWVKDLHHKWVQSTKSYNALSSIIIIICKSLNKKLSSSTQPGGWQIAVSLLPRQVSTDRGGEIGLKGGEGEAGGWIGCSEIQFFSTTTPHAIHISLEVREAWVCQIRWIVGTVSYVCIIKILEMFGKTSTFE